MPHLQLVSLTGTKYNEDVYEVLLPTMSGQIGVMDGHMPLISVAVTGAIIVRRNAQDSDQQLEYFAVSSGVLEIADNTVRVLVDEADIADDINESEAREAHERALKMKAEAKDQISLEYAQSLVDRTAVRLQVANLKHRHSA